MTYGPFDGVSVAKRYAKVRPSAKTIAKEADRLCALYSGVAVRTHVSRPELDRERKVQVWTVSFTIELPDQV